MPPLEPIHWSKITFPPVTQPYAIEIFPRPVAFPDIDPLVGQHFAVRAARYEPQEFLDHAPEENALGGE
jgi:hypothetical protein